MHEIDLQYLFPGCSAPSTISEHHFTIEHAKPNDVCSPSPQYNEKHIYLWICVISLSPRFIDAINLNFEHFLYVRPSIVAHLRIQTVLICMH